MRAIHPVEAIRHRYFPVLDHGFVALVDSLGDDPAIERAARVSYGQGTRKKSDTRTLLRYLLRHRHTTPFEMVELVFHMAMPIFVARQVIRTRTASVNEASGRYSLLPMLFYMPEEQNVRRQSATNKQGRSDDGISEEDYEHIEQRLNDGRDLAVSNYKGMVQRDVARELARIDLPLSTYTQWYFKIDLHNLLRFLGLRVDPHAQWETQQYARVMAGLAQCVAPLAYEAWQDYQLGAVTFSRQERLALRDMLRSPGSSRAEAVERAGLSARERDEFSAKLDDRSELPDLTLDLFESFDAAHFEARFTAATLQIDRAPP